MSIIAVEGFLGAETMYSNALGGVIAGGLGGLAVSQMKRKNLGVRKGGRAKKGNVVNAQAQRASMKTTGKKNIKGIRGRKAKVKVSKKLRDKINKVIEAKRIFGSYHTVRQGTIGVAHILGGINGVQNNITSGVYNGDNLWYTTSNAALGACRWWFNGFSAAGVAPEAGDDFLYFTPIKFMDAASILWNNKIMRKDYGNVAGNISARTVLLTGVPAASTAALPNLGGNVIHVRESYVKFEMKNLSTRVMRLKIHQCTPKVKFPDNLPLQSVTNGVFSYVEGLDNELIRHAPAGTDAAVNDPYFPIGMIPGVKDSWKWATHDMVMQPGETCVHYLRGPKNMTINYNKLNEAGADKTGFAVKGMSASVLIEVIPDMVYATTGVGGAFPGVGRFIPNTVALPVDTIGFPIAVEIVEVIKLSMPENSGFYTQAVAVPSTQAINLRREQHAFANFTKNQDEVTTAYEIRNEENMADAEPASVLG